MTTETKKVGSYTFTHLADNRISQSAVTWNVENGFFEYYITEDNQFILTIECEGQKFTLATPQLDDTTAELLETELKAQQAEAAKIQEEVHKRNGNNPNLYKRAYLPTYHDLTENEILRRLDEEQRC